MINTKYTTALSILLISLAVIGIGFAMVWQGATTDKLVGTFSYSDAHTITVIEDDYYNGYSALGLSKINLNGDTATAESRNVNVNENNITIRGGGTYVLSGTYNGSIIVDSADSAIVHLVLNNAHINSPDFSALYVKQAEKTVISTIENTENSFTDAESYAEDKQTDSKPDAAVYSKDELTVNGKGTLTINGNFADGLKANDGLKITEGTLKITAKDEGINANDYILCMDVSLEIHAYDAIRAKHEDGDKGFIALEKTVLNITATDDGVYASSSVYMNATQTEITAGGDAVHAGRDAILAPKALNIAYSREGIEGAYIEINGGEITIVSSDDAINAVGENANTFGRPGMFMRGGEAKTAAEDYYLVLNGGHVHITSSGDGFDSNGSAKLNGGTLEIYGPENGGNSSIDTGDGGYVLTVNGGTLLAAGNSGMAEAPDESSTQNTIVFYLEENYTANSTIKLLDSSGNEVLCGTATKRFNWVCVSNPVLAQGETYTLVINEKQISSVELNGTVTTQGNRERSRWQW